MAGSLLAASVTSVAFVADAAAAPPPPQRAYELVTPVDKGASDIAAGSAATADGDAVVYVSYGDAAGSPNADFGTFYRADRAALGLDDGRRCRRCSRCRTARRWRRRSTRRTSRPTSRPCTPCRSAPPRRSSPEDTNDSVDVYASTAGGVHALALARPRPRRDRRLRLRRALRRRPHRRLRVQPADPARRAGIPATRPNDPAPGVYELVDGAPRLVSLVDDGPAPTSRRPAARGSAAATRRRPTPRRRIAAAISADGSRIFFTAGGQLYVRIDGTRTVLVSASQVDRLGRRPGADGAMFAGASRRRPTTSRSRSADPLVDGATGGGLYGYDVDSGTLTPARRDRHASRPAPCARRPTARASTSSPTTSSTARAPTSSSNLWVAHADGTRRFIATLDPPTAAIDERLRRERRTSRRSRPTARAWPSRARRSSAATTAAAAPRCTSTTTPRSGSTCASCPSGGADPTGPATLRDPATTSARSRATSRATGDVFFETPEQLSDADTDDRIDVYEYTGGRAVLMSTGTSTDTHYVDNSADGSTVFLRTRDALVRRRHRRRLHGHVRRRAPAAASRTPRRPRPAPGSACRPAPEPGPGPPAAPPTVVRARHHARQRRRAPGPRSRSAPSARRAAARSRAPAASR